MVSSSPTSNSWHQPCKCCIRHHHHQHQSRKPSQCHPMILNLAWSSVLHSASLYITQITTILKAQNTSEPKPSFVLNRGRFTHSPRRLLCSTTCALVLLCCTVGLLCCTVVLLCCAVLLFCCAVVLLCCAVVLLCCALLLCSCVVLLCCCADPGASLVSRRCPKQSRRRRQLSCSSSCYPTETRQLSNIYS